MSVVRYRKPQQLLHLGQRHAVVEASAGTGKTYVLEHLVVDLLLTRGARLDEILVVTFTEKATAELIERVRQKLAQLAALRPEDPAAREALSAPDDECWTLDDRARERLREALFQFDHASIFTIHGFCQRVLVDHAFVQGRFLDEEAVDEEQAFHTAFSECLRRDIAPHAEHADLLAAWMGEGNTITRLERGVLLKAHRQTACLFPPREEGLLPRFDPAALRAAIDAWEPVASDDKVLCEVLKKAGVHHSTARSVVEQLGELSAEIDRTRDQPLAFVAALDRFCAQPKRKDKGLPYLADALATASRDARATRLHHQVALLRELPSLSATLVQRFLPLVRARLVAHKRDQGLFDFQDMLSLVAACLADPARGATLRSALRGQYRFALIDEFQDTDEVQWSIFRQLFFDGGRHVLTVIGDPKQAIYAFRGADVHTYLGAARAIAEVGGATVHLTANHRSTDPLIRAYNTILEQAADEPFFRTEGPIRYDHPVGCGRPTLSLQRTDGTAAPPVVLLSIETQQPTLLTWQVKQALKAQMVREIQALLSDDGPTVAGTSARRRLTGKDIFVLTRTVRESREIGDALSAAGVPHAFFKQEKLFQTAQAAEVLDLLRAIEDPEDRTARARALITPFFGLSLPDLAACDDLPADHPLVARLDAWKALAERGDFEGLFAQIVETSGITCRELFLHESERALTNYLHVLEILQEEAARRRSTLRELAEALDAWIHGTRRPPGDGRDIQRLETDREAVQIMTIHHSKGLEAEAVFLYGGFWWVQDSDVVVFHDDEGRRVVRVGRLPPDQKDRANLERWDEERRVLYVALTRARSRLYLPLFPPAFKTMTGSYSLLNRRLQRLAEEEHPLFARVSIPCPADPVAPTVVDAGTLAAWRPPALVLEDDAEAESSHRSLADARAGFLMTSYSALKRRGGLAVPPDDAAADEGRGDDPVASAAPDELPRGRRSGSFLHEILEHVPLESLTDDASAWQARPEIATLLERMRRRHDRSPVHLPHAARLVHTALTAPVALGGGTLPGFARAPRLLREMEFLYPIPERAQPLLGTTFADDHRAFRIERGVVKGFIDLLFEHEGKVWVADWKGDSLPAWDERTLRAHCARHYDVQARLYTLAALRLLGITSQADFTQRFGGVLFAFLRGMRPDQAGAGVVQLLPGWDEVCGWEAALLADDLGRSW